MVPALLCGCAALVLGLPSEGRLLLGRVRSPGRPRAHAVVLSQGRRQWQPAVPGAPGLGLPVVGVLVVASLVAGLHLGPVVAALVALAAVVATRVGRARRLAREAARERRRAAEACRALVDELRAGRALADALDEAAQVATGASAGLLADAAGAARLGRDVPAVLRRTVPTAVPELLLALAACWQVCARSGSGLATAVERLVEADRDRQEQRRAVEAALAGPRATAGLLAVLPLGGTGLAALLGADPLGFLLRTPGGMACLLLGLALDGLGVAWTRRLVRGAAR